MLSYDFDKKLSGEACYQNVKHFSRPGSVVVFHDSVKAQENMLYSLTKTLIYFSQLGYKFECLNQKSIQKSVFKPVSLTKKMRIFSLLF